MKNIEGNYYDKHNSKNPIVKALMSNFHRIYSRFIQKTKTETILDIGCGEGYTTKILKNSNKEVFIEGIEYGKEMVKKAKKINPDIHFEEGSIYNISRKDASYDMTLASEVLEHLEDPLKGLLELKRVSKKFVLVSVPNEPWWRIVNVLRLKYLKDLGNTPGHLNHWSGKNLYRFLRPNFKRVIIKNAVLWNIALCIKE